MDVPRRLTTDSNEIVLLKAIETDDCLLNAIDTDDCLLNAIETDITKRSYLPEHKAKKHDLFCSLLFLN